MVSVRWCVCFVSTLAAVACLSSATRPHILFILADDLGWNDVGFHGSDIHTPNIDRLAHGGVILNNYYVSPICTPTRGALLTGRYPIHLGLQHYAISAAEPWGLPLNHTTMADHLRGLGYRTHLVGKWHLGFFKSEYLPTNRGFDSHFGFWTAREDFFTHEDIDTYTGLDFRRNLAVTKVTGYSTDLFTEEAADVIMQHDTSQPLFLYLAHQATHAGNVEDPLQAPRKYVDRFPYITDPSRRTYAGMVAALDDSVGKVVQTLESRDMLDNTVIVFSTDNGGPANRKGGSAACNFPLRGAKDTLWEGGVRGAGFIYSHLLDNPGSVSNNMAHVTDWLPTLYSAAGGNPLDLGQIDGVDLWSMLKTGGEPVRTEILHNIDPVRKRFAFRSGDFKIIGGDQQWRGRFDGWYPCTPTFDTGDDSGCRKRDPVHELIENRDQGFREKFDKDSEQKHVSNFPVVIACGTRPDNASTNCIPSLKPCLFNIAMDPCEYQNLADQYPEVVAKLLDQVDLYQRSSVKPVNQPEDPNADPGLHNGVWVPWLDGV